MDLNKLADLVVLTVKSALAPVLERVAASEARLSVLGDLRDRVVTVETKAAALVIPEPGTFDAAPLLAKMQDVEAILLKAQERLIGAEARLSVLGDLRDRVVTVETKAATRMMPEPVAYDAAPLLAKIQQLESDLTKAHERLVSRLGVVETNKETREALAALRDLVTMSAKSSDLSAISASTSDIAKDISLLRERVAVVEVKPLLPGPAGKDGLNGKDGANGLNGKDGADGLGVDDFIAEHDGERTFTLKYARGERVKAIGTFTVPSEIYRGVFVDGRTYTRGDCVTWGGSEFHCNEDTTAKPEQSKAWTLKVKRGRDGRDGKDAVTLPIVSVTGAR